MKLLIVDDSNILRKAIEKYLARFSMTIVGTAGDGEAALEIFKREQPDFVTMDITMPKMDGLECLSRMMSLNPNVKVLIISALSDPQTGLDALKRGARGFIHKPIREETLVEEVSLILKGDA
jgi:two-component system, chemotaxis family, chemotaxis protein CheY